MALLSPDVTGNPDVIGRSERKDCRRPQESSSAATSLVSTSFERLSFVAGARIAVSLEVCASGAVSVPVQDPLGRGRASNEDNRPVLEVRVARGGGLFVDVPIVSGACKSTKLLLFGDDLPVPLGVPTATGNNRTVSKSTT